MASGEASGAASNQQGHNVKLQFALHVKKEAAKLKYYLDLNKLEAIAMFTVHACN
jgi:hypothetical protein